MKLIKVYLFICLFVYCNKSYSRLSIGNFDVAHPLQGLQGWAIDPDFPSANITVHFYANAPVGSAGSVYIGSTIANGTRPDVNTATGFPGNHGFKLIVPVNLSTPCRISIYVYAIDINNGFNPLLGSCPRLMSNLDERIIGSGLKPIEIKSSSQYGGAIYSLKWNGKQFVNSYDHGRLLQSASSFYSFVNPQNSWTAECYNPTEAGSHSNGSSTCTDSELLSYSAVNNTLTTKTQMAFYGRPGVGTNTCSPPINTSLSALHIVEKKVQIGIPNMTNVIKYDVKYSIPASESYLAMGQFEVIASYLNSEFNTFFHYNQSSQTLTQINNLADSESYKPMIISTSNGLYAMGIYSPEVPNNLVTGKTYGWNQYSDCNKFNFIRRILNVQAGSVYNFNAYLCVGTLPEVTAMIAQLTTIYPN